MRILLATTAIALFAAATPAWAGPAAPAAQTSADDAVARAAKQFVEGQKAFGAGDYRRAAALFEGAYRDKPHHSALWNAARSWQRAGEEIHAANLYARFLSEAPSNAPDRDQANIALKELATRMGRIELHGAEGVSNLRLDAQAFDVPLLYVAPGEHLAEADSAKGAIRKTVKVDAGQTVSVTLEPPPDPAPPPPVAPPVETPRPGGLPPVVFITGAALSAVGGGLVIASGLDTVSKRDAFLAEPTQDNLDAGNASQARTNVAIGVTVGVAVVTAAIGLFFTDWGGRETTSPPRAVRRLGPGGLAF